MFTGLQVGGEGIFLQLATVNVANEGDEKLLAFLDSDVFKGGLQLLTTAQPALAPFSALAVGLTQAIAARNRNVAVQAVDLGLDFSQVALRPRLAEGSYIAVQIPETIRTVWDWQDWAYDPAGRPSGQHRRARPADPLQLSGRQRQPLPGTMTGRSSAAAAAARGLRHSAEEMVCGRCG